MGVNLNKWVNDCLFIEESGLLGKGVYMMRLGGVWWRTFQTITFDEGVFEGDLDAIVINGILSRNTI